MAQITKAVIAYRGTENRSGQTWPDWSTNVANALGFEPRQYVLARERLETLTAGLLAESGAKALPIYAVGHSLGGGLAQQAGYLSRNITEVYAFNTSPVTNWTNLRLQGLVKNGYPIIHRVHNGGEGLAGIRATATATTAARHGRHDIGIQFGEKELIAGHSMAMLACGFAKILSQTRTQDADHGYPIDYIRQYVLLESDDGVTRNGIYRVCNKEPRNTGTVDHTKEKEQ